MSLLPYRPQNSRFVCRIVPSRFLIPNFSPHFFSSLSAPFPTSLPPSLSFIILFLYVYFLLFWTCFHCQPLAPPPRYSRIVVTASVTSLRAKKRERKRSREKERQRGRQQGGSSITHTRACGRGDIYAWIHKSAADRNGFVGGASDN